VRAQNYKEQKLKSAKRLLGFSTRVTARRLPAVKLGEFFQQGVDAPKPFVSPVSLLENMQLMSLGLPSMSANLTGLLLDPDPCA
jgi:hypothetical protein